MIHQRIKHLRNHRWLAGLLLMATGTLTGCAFSDDRAHGKFDRPLGRRFAHFFEMVGNVPEAISEDYTLRRKRLGQSFTGIGRRFGQEVAHTMAHPGPDVVGDTRLHWPLLTASLWNLGENTSEDVYYAVPRLWHGLKLLE